MLPTKEVVSFIKNNNCFNITYKFDLQPSTFKSLFEHIYNFFYCFYGWIWRPHRICLEQISIRFCPKYFEGRGFPCCILNNTFSETGHRNQKNFMMSGKLGTSANKMVYREGTFLWWGLFIPSFKPIAYIVDKQRDVCRSTLYYRDSVRCVSKLQRMYEIGLILLSVLETTKQTRLYQI